jgi:hypothetical protein
MTVCDDLAAMDSAAETFVWKTMFGLRKARNGDSGELCQLSSLLRYPTRPARSYYQPTMLLEISGSGNFAESRT